MSNCEKEESIIVGAMELAQKQYTERIEKAINPENRLIYIDDYANTLRKLSKALRNISTEH